MLEVDGTQEEGEGGVGAQWEVCTAGKTADAVVGGCDGRVAAGAADGCHDGGVAAGAAAAGDHGRRSCE